MVESARTMYSSPSLPRVRVPTRNEASAAHMKAAGENMGEYKMTGHTHIFRILVSVE